MKRSETISELAKALTKFQKNSPKITKDQTANIPTKTGANYSYKYADLAGIWDKIRGIMADNGLSIIQSPTSTQGESALTTMLLHESGEWVEDTMKLSITQDSPQGQGSAITYARRYSLCSMLGIVADEDNDAQDHKLASTISRKRIADASRKVMPELAEDNYGLVRFISEMVGKHPNRILESEVEDAIHSIEMYTAKEISD